MLSAININNKYLFNAYSTSKISKFLYSDFYYLSLVIFIALFWALGYTQGPIFMFIGLSVVLVLCEALLILQKDILPIMPLVFMAMCVVSTKTMPSYMWAISFFVVLVAIAVIFHIVFYRNANYRFGKMFLPLCLFGVALLLGGIGARVETTSHGKLMSIVLLSVCPLFISWMMENYIDPNCKATDYVAKMAAYLGLLIAIELCLYYIIKIDFIKENLYKAPHLGWGISNSIATFFLITFPFCFYLFVQEEKKYKAYGYLLLGVLEFFAIFLTTSRGALLFGMAEFAITVVATIFSAKGKKRKDYFIFVAIIIVIGLIVFFVMKDKIMRGINIIFVDKLQDNGRFPIYREAISCFFEYPIFGVGFGYSGHEKYLIDTMGIYQFHDTILQMVACLGIVGLLAYLYYYYVKLEIVFEKPTNYSLYLIMVYLGYEGYSLLNTGTIQGFPTVTLVVALTVAQAIQTNQEDQKIYSYLRNKLKRNKKVEQTGEVATKTED